MNYGENVTIDLPTGEEVEKQKEDVRELLDNLEEDEQFVFFKTKVLQEHPGAMQFDSQIKGVVDLRGAAHLIAEMVDMYGGDVLEMAHILHHARHSGPAIPQVVH